MRASIITLLVATLGIGACGEDNASPGPPQGARVAATAQLRFDPVSVSIARGGSVTWEFGTVPHNVVFDTAEGRPDDIPGLNTGVAIPRSFAQLGTFRYACTIHPGMTGAVTVSNPATPGYSTLP